MSSVEEVKAIEKQMIQAELGPDPQFFESILADEALLDGQKMKTKVVAAHQPGKGPKFTNVEMDHYEFIDHGSAVVVTCHGHYTGPQWSGSLKFMRVWVKKESGWQVVAGTTAEIKE
jgi:hypothetical protein